MVTLRTGTCTSTWCRRPRPTGGTRTRCSLLWPRSAGRSRPSTASVRSRPAGSRWSAPRRSARCSPGSGPRSPRPAYSTRTSCPGMGARGWNIVDPSTRVVAGGAMSAGDERLGVTPTLDAALVEHLRNPGSFDGLQEAADILTDVLLSHLAYEEAQLVEPLARHGFYGGQL